MNERSDKRPWLAAVLAFIYPGLGHVYLREWLRALVWFGLVVTSSMLLIDADNIPDGISVDAVFQLAQSVPIQTALALFSITLFSMIDAYWIAKRNKRETAVQEGTTCPHCGKDVDPDLEFCHWCTEPLGSPEDVE